jgi:hypothetical protein
MHSTSSRLAVCNPATAARPASSAIGFGSRRHNGAVSRRVHVRAADAQARCGFCIGGHHEAFTLTLMVLEAAPIVQSKIDTPKLKSLWSSSFRYSVAVRLKPVIVIELN